MSAFGEFRVETCLSVLPLLAPSSPFPLPHIWFMCCWLPPSPGLDPEHPPSPFIWFEAVGSLAGNPPTDSHLKAPCTPTCVCTGMWCLWLVHASTYPILNVNPCTRVLYMQTYPCICTHTQVFPCLPSLGSFWLTVPTPARDYAGKQGVERVEVPGRGEGVWGRGEGEWEREPGIRPSELH